MTLTEWMALFRIDELPWPAAADNNNSNETQQICFPQLGFFFVGCFFICFQGGDVLIWQFVYRFYA